MRPNLRALFWDNDGILVETEGLYFESTRQALAEVGVELSAELFRQVFLKSATGVGHFFPEGSTIIQEIRARRDALYTEVLNDTNPVMPHVAEILERLSPRYRMAIVTSCPRHHFDQIHRSTGILHHFEFLLTPELYSRSKPDPEPALLALQRMGLDREECLIVEDSERGLASACAAGIKCVAIPSELTREGDFSAASGVLRSISELPEYIAREYHDRDEAPANGLRK